MPPAFKKIVSLPTREDSRGRRRRNANILESIFWSFFKNIIFIFYFLNESRLFRQSFFFNW
jgi:hypothetical protein